MVTSYDFLVQYQRTILVLTIGNYILMTVWVFKIRNRLNRSINEFTLPCMPLGSIITFFFQEFYLSYKVNEIIETLQEKAN